jgi:hypothetical protein
MSDSAQLVAEDLVPGIPYATYADRLELVADALAQERTDAHVAKLVGRAAAAVWDEGLRAAQKPSSIASNRAFAPPGDLAAEPGAGRASP